MSKLRVASKPSVAIDKAAIAQKLPVDQALEDALADTDKPTAEQSAAESAVEIKIEGGRSVPDLVGLAPDAEPNDPLIDGYTTPAGSLRVGLLDPTAGSESDKDEDPQERGENPLAGMFEGDGAQGTHDKSEYTDANGDSHHRTVSTYEDMVVVTDINIDAGKETMTFLVNGKALTSESPWPPIEPIDASGEDDSSEDASDEDSSGEGASDGDSAGEESSGGGLIDAIVDFFSDLFSGNDDSEESSADSGADTSSTPDEDYISPQERMALQKSLGLDQIYRPSHDNDEIQPVEGDGADSANTAVSQVSGPIDLKDKLLGGDTVDPDLEHVRGGGVPGDQGDLPLRNDGAIDPGPDHADPQTSGREERDTRQKLEPGATTSQDAESAKETGDGSGTPSAHRAGEGLLERLEQHGTLQQFEPAKLDKSLLDLVRATLVSNPLDGLVPGTGGAPSPDAGPLPLASPHDLPGPTLVHDQAQLFA